MTVLIIGGSGFIGSRLSSFLHAAGYPVRVLSRNPNPRLPSFVTPFCWQQDGNIPDAALEQVSAVINLAGETVATGRWNKSKKERIVASRLQTTQAMVTALRHQKNTPLVIQASASGYYGDKGQTLITENTEAGRDFLATTAKRWEETLTTAGLENRYLIMRLGMVLGPNGGAMVTLKKIYKIGAGASLGSGRQYLSWVHVDDVCLFVLHALRTPTCQGIYNIVSPQAVTYDTLHQALRKHFGVKVSCPIRIPSWFLHLVLGEKANLVTTSQRIVPQKAQTEGFVFKYPDLATALSQRERISAPTSSMR